MDQGDSRFGGAKSGSGHWRILGAMVLVSVVGAPVAVRAAHPLITDDAGTLGRGAKQLELTAELSRDVEGTGAERVGDDTGEGAIAVGYGIAEALDVVVSAATTWSRTRREDGPVSDTRGLGDVGIDLKWRAFEAGGFALALKPGITLPTGDAERGLGTGRACASVTLVASQQLGRVTLHANLGYLRDDYARREDREASRRDRLHASFAGTVELAPKLRLVADVGAETNPDRASSTWPAYALGGVIVSAGEHVEIDAGIKAGLSAPEADWSGLLGVTYHF